jgi:hypothetical protein
MDAAWRRFSGTGVERANVDINLEKSINRSASQQHQQFL